MLVIFLLCIEGWCLDAPCFLELVPTKRIVHKKNIKIREHNRAHWRGDPVRVVVVFFWGALRDSSPTGEMGKRGYKRLTKTQAMPVICIIIYIYICI